VEYCSRSGLGAEKGDRDCKAISSSLRFTFSPPVRYGKDSLGPH